MTMCHKTSFKTGYTLFSCVFAITRTRLVFIFLHTSCHGHDSYVELNWIETGTCNAPFIQSPQKRSAAVHIVTKKYVFSNFLKTGKVKVPSLRSVGRLFQATGPATEKPRPPIVTVLVGGMRRSPAAAERNWEWPAWEESGTQNSDRYAGAASWRHL